MNAPVALSRLQVCRFRAANPDAAAMSGPFPKKAAGAGWQRRDNTARPASEPLSLPPGTEAAAQATVSGPSPTPAAVRPGRAYQAPLNGGERECAFFATTCDRQGAHGRAIFHRRTP